ncbi:MAG: lipopolysaccharide transport system permease protein [Sphingomonadales bacterium]|nr:lipopolysaccharide transport system permease protein [Sphingomonadales bacterium]
MATADSVPEGRDKMRAGASERAGGRLGAAWADIAEGARHWPQWFTLAGFDIKLRFRRTGLGPLWSTLSFCVFAGALGLVYGRVLGEEVTSYLPYVVLGLFVWTFIATTLQEACDAFIHAEHVLKHLYVPKSTLIYRTLCRNLILLAFNLIAVAAVLLLCGTRLPPAAALAVAGLVILCLNLLWISLLLALFTARFRALSRIVHVGLPIGMLVTPVIWRPALPTLRELANWNPLHFAIELVRGPILGETPDAWVWIAVLAFTLAGALLAFLTFSAFRSRIPYWL